MASWSKIQTLKDGSTYRTKQASNGDVHVIVSPPGCNVDQTHVHYKAKYAGGRVLCQVKENGRPATHGRRKLIERINRAIGSGFKA